MENEKTLEKKNEKENFEVEDLLSSSLVIEASQKTIGFKNEILTVHFNENGKRTVMGVSPLMIRDALKSYIDINFPNAYESTPQSLPVSR